MKRLLIIIFFTFNFHSLINADDISSITIEGISIGDSALDFFSKEDIDKNSYDFYKIKTFVPVQINKKFDFFKTFDAVDFNYRTGDKNFTIVAIDGVLLIRDPIKCEKKLDQIVIDIAPILEGNHEIEKATVIHDSDPSGKSKIVEKQWIMQNGDRVLVQCYNFDVNYNSGNNNLSISIRTKEFHNFLRKIAYKDSA
tara:strand:- start:270 stop:860 length:591 start_codon:yes stop_codon:yes gene_type:complete